MKIRREHASIGSPDFAAFKYARVGIPDDTKMLLRIRYISDQCIMQNDGNRMHQRKA